MTKTVKRAAYYDYEGETLIITRFDDNRDCIVIETFQSYGDKNEGRSTYITMLREDWIKLIAQVADL